MWAARLAGIALLCAIPTTALADGDSALTLGVGAGVGYLRATQPTAENSDTTFVNQANVRLKALYVLGIDYSVDLSKGDDFVATGDELQFAAKMRLTTLLYAIPTQPASLYFGVGVGGREIGDLASFTSSTNSYHGGIGLEVALSDHISIDSSFYLVIPGVSSIERHVEQLALSAAAAQKSAGGASSLETTTASASVGDYVNIRNYELMIRLFIFL
ncbi:MAG: outer membrane beta-barrel protein [Myxococcales bacterium]|nr:outer membrane beta-barrel protein [Myxococcales bacterium]MCB9732833.1 outer membrane beta-barrel protein [Deltaproteobacteria bacterium]